VATLVNIVSTMTGNAGWSRRIVLNIFKPSACRPPGMEKSVINRSHGVLERMRIRLSVPSASATTTHRLVALINIRNPMRTTQWSSAITTRIVGGLLLVIKGRGN
jgi:hypothetical protein